jgi:hypothetical protein
MKTSLIDLYDVFTGFGVLLIVRDFMNIDLYFQTGLLQYK